MEGSSAFFFNFLIPVFLSDAKITKNPIACFLCLLKNFISCHELNQECILKEDAVAIIGSLLMKCRTDLYDVNILMAMQLLIEAIQNDMPTANLELLRSFYRDIVFDFRIWARTQFQIIIGHIQYIQAIIKEDRKYFRYVPYSYRFGLVKMIVMYSLGNTMGFNSYWMLYKSIL